MKSNQGALAAKVVFLFFLSAFCTLGAESKKPNFIFILMDDMGWSDLSCYGSEFYQSPNIAKLAKDGMKFTQAYAACPVCSPTRASILTGQYPARLHLTDFIPGGKSRPAQKLLRPDFRLELPLEETTLAEALKPAGYVSGAFGKWHLGGKGFEPEQQGFAVYFAGNPKGGSPNSDEPEKGEYEITERALHFIEANKDKPFFLYVPYWSVHIPLRADQKLVEKYEKLRKPDATHTNSMYAAMIESVDAQIGRLLAKLDALQLAENTVVIFTSDNGGLSVKEGERTPATSNHPSRAGKGYLYEGGLRVPLLVRWPGVVKAGTVCRAAVSSIDYFPTLLEIAGVTISNSVVDGVSLLPLLKQTGELKPRALYWHYPHYSNQGGEPGAVIREGDLKLIEFYEEGRWELYNLQNDPGEKNNLFDQHGDKAAQLGSKLDLWRKEVGAQMILPNPDYAGNGSK